MVSELLRIIPGFPALIEPGTGPRAAQSPEKAVLGTIDVLKRCEAGKRDTRTSPVSRTDARRGKFLSCHGNYHI